MAHEWILYLQSNHQVSTRTGGLLGIHDLRQLRADTGWMTDALIDYAVTVYGGATGALRNHVLWLAPAVVSAGKDGNQGAFDNSIAAALGAPAFKLDDPAVDLPQHAKAVLFPVNTSESHWSLLVLYHVETPQQNAPPLKTREFVHYDSLGQSNDAAATALLQKLLDNNYLSQLPVFSKPNALVQQVDGYNCGLYVAQFARKIMEVGRKLNGGEVGAAAADVVDARSQSTRDTARWCASASARARRPRAPAFACARSIVASKEDRDRAS